MKIIIISLIFASSIQATAQKIKLEEGRVTICVHDSVSVADGFKFLNKLLPGVTRFYYGKCVVKDGVTYFRHPSFIFKRKKVMVVNSDGSLTKRYI